MARPPRVLVGAPEHEAAPSGGRSSAEGQKRPRALAQILGACWKGVLRRLGGGFNLYGSEGPAPSYTPSWWTWKRCKDLPVDEQGKWPHDLWDCKREGEGEPGPPAKDEASVREIEDERRQCREACKRGHDQVDAARVKSVSKNPKGSIATTIHRQRFRMLWADILSRELFARAEQLAEQWGSEEASEGDYSSGDASCETVMPIPGAPATKDIVPQSSWGTVMEIDDDHSSWDLEGSRVEPRKAHPAPTLSGHRPRGKPSNRKRHRPLEKPRLHSGPRVRGAPSR